MALLAGGIIQPNATVRVESAAVTQDSEGGSQEAYSVLASGLRVLLSSVNADRTDGLGGQHNKVSGSMAGKSEHLARVDVRYFVETDSNYGLTGVFLYPDSASVHGATGAGVMRAAPYYRVKWSTVRTT